MIPVHESFDIVKECKNNVTSRKLAFTLQGSWYTVALSSIFMKKI